MRGFQTASKELFSELFSLLPNDAAVKLNLIKAIFSVVILEYNFYSFYFLLQLWNNYVAKVLLFLSVCVCVFFCFNYSHYYSFYVCRSETRTSQ